MNGRAQGFDEEAELSAESGGSDVSGVRIGDYELIRRLPTGGMAEVFVARKVGIEGFEKVVALKRTLPHLARNKRFVGMFLDEARLAARLNHPNIVSVHDIGRCGEDFFFTMEYLHGENLHHLLAQAVTSRRGLPLELALWLGTHICEGLHHAHELTDGDENLVELVHRDVSPTNVMVTYEGAVKVLDFGVAKAASQSQITKAGVTKGKASYMSPEQCLGEPLDRRSDVFCLGILVWEMTTLHRLFRGDSDLLVMNEIATKDAPAPSTIDPSFPRELETIIMKALARDRDERYPTARAFAADLSRFARVHNCLSSSATLSEYMRVLFGRKPHPWRQPKVITTAPEVASVSALDLEGVEASPRGESLRSAIASVPGAASMQDGAPAADGPHGDAYGDDSGAAVGPGSQTPSPGFSAADSGARARAADSFEHPPTAPAMRSLGETGEAVTVHPSRSAPKVLAAVVGLCVLAGGVAGVTYRLAAPSGDTAGGTQPPAASDREPGAHESAAATGAPCPDGMVYVEAAAFTMGTDEPAVVAVRPRRPVAVEGFCMDQHEVTAAQYLACSSIGECKRAFGEPRDGGQSEQEVAAGTQLCNGRKLGHEDHPVNCVTWEQARRFCGWRGATLPSESQWELAARGPQARQRFPWGMANPRADRLNACGEECRNWRVGQRFDVVATMYSASDDYPGSAPVGRFPEGDSLGGIAELAGNVGEWTEDVYDQDQEVRAVRGGTFWSTNAAQVTGAARAGRHRQGAYADVGFRCVAPTRPGGA